MYKVIYFSELNIVTDKDFPTLTAATAFYNTLDWGVIVTISESRTITDVTPT